MEYRRARRRRRSSVEVLHADQSRQNSLRRHSSATIQREVVVRSLWGRVTKHGSWLFVRLHVGRIGSLCNCAFEWSLCVESTLPVFCFRGCNRTDLGTACQIETGSTLRSHWPIRSSKTTSRFDGSAGPDLKSIAPDRTKTRRSSLNIRLFEARTAAVGCLIAIQMYSNTSCHEAPRVG